MTDDTRRALDIIKPIADFFHIEVTADNNFLIINGQPIGITCNSTRATLFEFIGYMIDVYCDEKGVTYKDLQDRIHRCWYNDEQVKSIKAIFGGDDNEK